MKLWLNGEETLMSGGEELDDVLRLLGILDSKGVAIAIDGEVVPKSEWEQTKLKDGQKVEVVRAVQGG